MGHRLSYRNVFYFFPKSASSTVRSGKYFHFLIQKREPYRYNLNTVSVYFYSVGFALFVKSLKMVRFLERYGSRYKILTENGNELCTVRFALLNEKTEHGGLFGAVRLAVKNRNGTLD